MTPEDVKTMTDEKLRIRVGELCGLRNIVHSKIQEILNRGAWDGWYGTSLKHKCEVQLPNYPEDLNAMASAVKEMVEKHGIQWTVKFNHDLYGILGHHDHVEHEAVHATAKQRAQAFILAATEGIT